MRSFLSRLHQTVAGIDTKDFMFGIFALGPKPTNFSDFNDPQPSYMWSLKNQSIIPSLSWAYTAGAFYNNTLGSLVLGGYDAAIYDLGNRSPQDTQFNMDLSYNMPIGLQAIVATDTLPGVVSLLPDGITSYIDSTVPEIWLPGPACDLFANAFGLQLDNATGRYLVNDTIHSQLLSLNPIITFKIGNTTYGGATIDIVFPYAAFDLQANYPIYPNGTNYFPIRRADNGSQYVIGRTFLQEAYLVVDYERGNFSISQRPVQQPRSQQSIIPILPNIHNAPHSGLSTGAIVGIAVAAVLFCLSLIGGACFSHRGRKRRIAAASPEAEKTEIVEVVDQNSMRAEPASVVEAPNELVWGSALHEIDSGLVQEIGGREVKAELPGT